jgi:ATP-dependent helicase/nuclease subunit A
MKMKYTKHQNEAIHHEGQNILVSASAGSGKTGVLKARVIRKIKDGIDIDKLIILTFTEAAAAEMKSRIIDELNQLGLKDQLIKLDNAIISTFDAFTLRLVKTYHYLLDLPSDIEISDALLIEIQSQTILEDVIKEFYQSQSSDFKALVKRYFSGNDYFLYKSIVNIAKAIKKMPNHDSVLNQYHSLYNDQMAHKAYDMYLDHLQKDLQFLAKQYDIYFEENYGVFSSACDEYLLACQTIYHNLAQPQKPKAFIDKVQAFSLPKKPRKPRGEEDWLEVNDNIKKQVQAIKKEMADAHLFDQDYLSTWQETLPSISVMLDMVQTYLKRMKTMQKQKNLYSFDDIMSFAIQLFEENDGIRQHYKDTINEILIDEYQDTNDLQDYFISLIANQNIFMVGDVKQSIYRFRDANPKNFMRLLENYQKQDGGQAIRLLENFRSNRFLLDTINKLFLKLMTQDRGGVDYKDNHQLMTGYPDHDGLNIKNDPIHTHFYDFEVIQEQMPDIQKDQVEAYIVANDIQRKIKQRQSVYDGKNNRPIDYDDITILVDRKTSFDKYASILSRFSIPVNIYDRTVFTESEEIIFLTQYLKLLKGLKNQNIDGLHTALYSVARSFVYQIPDQDMIGFFVRTKGSYDDLKNYPALSAVFKDLSLIAIEIDVLSNIEILDKIYQTLNIYQKIGHLTDVASKSRKLDFFYALIEKQKDKSFQDLIDYLDFIQEQRDVDIEYTEKRSDIKAVKMMSIHQSKGLQFPVVYMMGLHKKFNFQENKEVFNFSNDYGILTYANHSGIYRNYLERLYFRQLKNEDLSEKIRLMYVALTRAKEEINFVLQAKESLNLDKVNPSNYLEMLYDGFQLEAKDTITHLVLPEESQTKADPINHQTITYKHFSYPEEMIEDYRFSKSEKTLFTDEEKQALAYGESIHESLEHLDYMHLESSLKGLPQFIQSSIKHLASTQVFKSLKSPQYYQEYEFIDDKDGLQTTGIIDLLIEDQDQIIIIDYKLKDMADPAYVKQIQGYYQYLKDITTKPIKAYLYSLVHQTLKEIL